MFRLIKLGFYALIGYALYELYQGLTSGRSDFERPRSRDLGRALNRESGRMQTLTGPGIGGREKTVDSDGGSATHRVGRGVTAS